MKADCLKLTTYFGERDRSAHGLLADELLELYGRHGVEVSVLLRGIEGFGAKHQVHTDRLLTLSEDLPVVSVAVDERARIEALLPEVLAVKRRGLLTLERAALAGGAAALAELPYGVDEAGKLTVYVGRYERAGGRTAFDAVCGLLHGCGFSGATVLLGVDGTRHGERRRAQFFSGNAAVPMMIVAVGSGEQLAAAARQLGALLDRPLMTVERVRVCKRDGRLLARPHELPGTDEHGLPLWQKLMIHSSERARHDGHALHRVLVRRLRMAEIAGATSLRGVWGFHGDHAPHGDRLLQVHRHVPVVTVVIDTPERIADAFDVVDEVTAEGGLVTSEMVPASVAPARDAGHRGAIALARHRY